MTLKTCYVINVAPGRIAIADLDLESCVHVCVHKHERMAIINRINVPRCCRGEGIGSTLLRQICVDADSDHTVLMLHVSPSDGLNRRQLVKWYKRYGFVTESGWMVRYCDS